MAAVGHDENSTFIVFGGIHMCNTTTMTKYDMRNPFDLAIVGHLDLERSWSRTFCYHRRNFTILGSRNIYNVTISTTVGICIIHF